MQKASLIICAILFSCSSIKLNAQDKPLAKEQSFELSGQLRSRFEFRDGDFRPLSKSEKPAALVLNRVRLNVDYSYTDLLKTKISIQNVNVWGQANPIQTLDNSGNSFSIFEAWADIKIYKSLRAKVGRQTISLDDERIFGISDWTNSGRAHDALSLNWNKEKVHLKAFFAFNQNYNELNYNNNPSNPSGTLYNTKDAQSYKTMQTIWGKYDVDQFSNLSVLFTNLGLQNADSLKGINKVYNLQTLGANYFYNYPRLFGNISGYYQFGKSLNSKTTSAYLLSASIGTKVAKAWKVSIGTDYLSGNTYGNASSTNNSFQPLFGTGHKFYGNMDYYYAGNPYKDIGLIDNYLKVKYDYNAHIKLGLDVHNFSAPTKIVANNINYSKGLGQEFDFGIEYKANNFISLSGGYSGYFTNSTLLFIKNTPTAASFQQWAWVSLNIHPSFFKAVF